MYTQPAILLGVLALAGEVLSSSLAGEGAAARQNHARQVRMHRRRGLTGTNDTDNNPCKRASSSNASSGSTSFRVKDASNSSSRNVTAIPATSYIRQGNGEGASFSVSDSRQPLNEGSSDALSSERTSLQADTSADEGDSSSSSSSWSSSSASTTSSAAPSQSSTASTGGSGMSLATSWEGSAVSA